MKYVIIGGVHLQGADGFYEQGDQLGISHVSGALATQGHDAQAQVQGLEEMPPAAEADMAVHLSSNSAVPWPPPLMLLASSSAPPWLPHNHFGVLPSLRRRKQFGGQVACFLSST
jgi:hypothetical protein